jgi:hypothetical protein
MKSRTTRQNPPDALVEILDDLDVPTLRSVRTYVDQRIDDLRPTLPEMIRSETEGEIVDITESGPYTLVRKYPPSGDSSDTGPRPPSLYRVTREKQPNGDETLHLSYLGNATEPADVECGNCGVPLNRSRPMCPHCRETLSGDEGV